MNGKLEDHMYNWPPEDIYDLVAKVSQYLFDQDILADPEWYTGGLHELDVMFDKELVEELKKLHAEDEWLTRVIMKAGALMRAKTRPDIEAEVHAVGKPLYTALMAALKLPPGPAHEAAIKLANDKYCDYIIDSIHWLARVYLDDAANLM